MAENLHNLPSDKTISTASHQLSFRWRRRSHRGLNRRACSHQFCSLHDCLVQSVQQSSQDPLTDHQKRSHSLAVVEPFLMFCLRMVASPVGCSGACVRRRKRKVSICAGCEVDWVFLSLMDELQSHWLQRWICPDLLQLQSVFGTSSIKSNPTGCSGPERLHLKSNQFEEGGAHTVSDHWNGRFQQTCLDVHPSAWIPSPPPKKLKHHAHYFFIQ